MVCTCVDLHVYSFYPDRSKKILSQSRPAAKTLTAPDSTYWVLQVKLAASFVLPAPL
jgi:hypothetical protein